MYSLAKHMYDINIELLIIVILLFHSVTIHHCLYVEVFINNISIKLV